MVQYVSESRRLSKNCSRRDLKEFLMTRKIVCGVEDDVLRERLLGEMICPQTKLPRCAERREL